MSKKALRIRIYATSDLSELVIEKTGVHVDSLPGALELCPDGGLVVCDIVELPAVSGD